MSNSVNMTRPAKVTLWTLGVSAALVAGYFLGPFLLLPLVITEHPTNWAASLNNGLYSESITHLDPCGPYRQQLLSYAEYLCAKSPGVCIGDIPEC
jgi:hypothetical protein